MKSPLQHHSLRGKIFLRFTLLVSLALIATGAFSVLIARGVIRERTITQLLSLSNAHTRAINTTVDARRTMTRLLALDNQIHLFLKGPRGATARESLHSYLTEKTAVARSLQNIMIIDTEGNILVALASSLEGKNVAQTPDFQEGRQRTTVGTLGMASGRHSHAISSPLRSDTGTQLGVLIAEFSLHELYAALSESASLGKTAEFLLIEPRASGTACFSPRKQVFPVQGSLSPIAPFPEEFAGSGFINQNADRRILPPQDTTPFLCRLAASGVEDIITGHLDGQQTFAAHRFLPGLGLGVIVKVDSYEVFQPVRILLVALVGTTGILLLLVTFIALRLSRDVVNPILRLKKSLREINTGHWVHQQSVFTGDELEALDREVVRLAGRLKEAYSSLEERVEERTQELKQAHAKDEALLESIGEGVLAVDTHGKVLACNSAAAAMLQWDQKQLLDSHGSSVLPLFTKTGELLPPHDHPIERSMKEKVAVRTTLRESLECARKDASRFPISIIATPYLLNGEMHGVVVTFHDTTEERRMDRMKSEFVSLASHQLRTPLTAIGWYVELLDKEVANTLSKDQREYMQQIVDSHRRMVDLVNALLNVSRIELGALEIQPEEVDVSILVKKMLKELAPQIQEKNLKLKMDFPKSLKAMIDPQLLQVVLENLVSNAIKYTNEKEHIELSLISDEKEIQFNVKDSGLGIPKKDHARIFEKLFRSDNVRKTDTDGTGIGLYIVKHTVEAWRGRLWFESTEGKGTFFHFTVPRKMEAKEGEGRLTR